MRVWQRVFVLLAVLAIVLPAAMNQARAEGLHTTPINISLFTPVELVPLKPRRIVGVSLNAIYGHEEQLYGLQAGLVNHVDSGVGLQVGLAQWSDGDFSGIQLGLTNYTREFSGIQVAAGNITKRASGIQVSLGSNFSNTFSGIQISSWNTNREDFSGIQIGFVNENQVVTTGGGSTYIGTQEYTKLNRTYFI